MLTTKNLVNDYKDVDSRWVFEHYCKLKVKLKGQDIKINSLFNPNDNNPSMSIYVDKTLNEETRKANPHKVYKFKDFSTGIGGSAVDLVKELKGYSFHQAVVCIVEDYNEFILHNNGGYNVDEFKEHSKYQVTGHVKRSWNTKDQYQWTQYYIGSRVLDEYYVRPLESYTMSKTEDGIAKTLTIKGDYIYGYFTEDGTLYKIYQPKVKDKKYIKVKQYIQGSEQLKKYPYLAITSGLKDIMALKSLKLKLDLVSPDSENCLIPRDQINKWKKEYKKVLVFFDNDEAGIKAMKKYREQYNLPCVLLTLSKDPADSIRDYGPKKVTEKLVPLIDAQLCEL